MPSEPPPDRRQVHAIDALPGDASELIGRLLGDAREDARLSQATVAHALGVPQSRIAKIELGQRQLLLHEAILLADLYGLPLERLDPRRYKPRPRRSRRARVDAAKQGAGTTPS